MSVTELLQRVPGIEVVKPPKSTLVMVLQTTPFAEDNPSEEGSKAISKKFTKVQGVHVVIIETIESTWYSLLLP